MHIAYLIGIQNETFVRQNGQKDNNHSLLCRMHSLDTPLPGILDQKRLECVEHTKSGVETIVFLCYTVNTPIQNCKQANKQTNKQTNIMSGYQLVDSYT
jgi:hypothetical protein